MYKYIIVIFIFLTATQCTSGTSAKYSEKLIEVGMREIGNRVLLSVGDSTSRVLPVRKEGNNYIIPFEREIAISSDTLYNIISEVLHDMGIEEYLAELKSCDDDNVIAAIAGQADQNLEPCRGREIPPDCYHISISIKQKPRFKNRLYAIVLLVLFFMMAIYIRQILRKKKVPSIDSNKVKIGNILFLPDENTILINDEAIILTQREGKLLHILSQNIGNTVKREDLMDEIWGESGILVVSKNLDVLVSKLRKKIKDDNLEITNVYGTGYKLELRQI